MRGGFGLYVPCSVEEYHTELEDLGVAGREASERLCDRVVEPGVPGFFPVDRFEQVVKTISCHLHLAFPNDQSKQANHDSTNALGIFPKGPLCRVDRLVPVSVFHVDFRFFDQRRDEPGVMDDALGVAVDRVLVH